MAGTFGHMTPAGRRTAAEARQAESDKLSPKQRLARLDERLGAGVGAKQERARLARMAAKAKKA